MKYSSRLLGQSIIFKAVTSFLVQFMAKFFKIKYFYSESLLYRLKISLLKFIELSFKHSYLFTKIEAINKNIGNIFRESRFICLFIAKVLKIKVKIEAYLKTSIFINFHRDFVKESLYSYVQFISLIIIALTASNVLFSLLLDKGISFTGYIARFAFFVLGLAGLFCPAKWEDLKKESLVLKRIYG